MSAGPYVGRAASDAIARLAEHQLRRDEQNEKMFGQLAEIAQGFSSEIVNLGRSIVDLKKGAKEGEERLHSRVDGVQQELKELRAEATTSEFRQGLRLHYLPYLPLGFDGRTGNNLWCPVSFTDHNGIDRELVVLSLPCLSRFYAEECPNHIDAQTTMSFFMGPAMKRAPGLDYKDIINGLLLTGFSFLAVGKRWNQMRARNTARFVFVEAAWFKQLLAAIDTHFPDRPRVRDFVNGGKAPNYKADGVDYGFWQASPTDMSTGNIVQIAQTIPLLRKRMLPVMGETWVREWYTPMIAKFFDIPDDLVGAHHVVGSELDTGSGPVKLHRDALTDYKRRKTHQKYKRARVSKAR